MGFSISPATDTEQFECIEITELGGINTRDENLSLGPDEFTSLQNVLVVGRGFEKRQGFSTFNDEQTANKVVGLGFLEQDSGVTALMMANQTLYKDNSGSWAASDKTDYTADLDASIENFNSKSGAALDSGTSTSGSTSYQVEDTGQAWTPGEHQGRCVVIAGEIKYIADNDATTLILGDKLNSDTDADYQSVAYAIHALAPHAIIMNGTDAPQKYNLTTTTALDGTHVTNGKALPTASIGVSHNSRMWYATGTGDNNDRIYASDEGVAENITTDTNLNINLQLSNDGDEVTGMAPVSMDGGSILAVGKTKSVHVMEGDNILNYTTRPAIIGDGCVAKKSFVGGRGTAFFLGEKGVFSISDSGRAPLQDPLPISRDIQPTLDALSSAQRANACGAFFDNKYFLRAGTSMFYYDVEESLKQNKHIWVDLNYNFVDFNVLRVIDNSLYGGDAVKGQVYKLWTGNQDGSDNIEMILTSGEFSLSRRPHMWIDRLEFMAEKQTSTVLHFQHATDGGSFSTVESKTLSNDNRRYVFNVKKRCYSFKWKLTETGSNAAARIILPIRIFFARAETGEDGTKG